MYGNHLVSGDIKMIKCDNCGTMLLNGTKRCTNCGVKQKLKFRGILLFVAGAVGFLIVFIYTSFYLVLVFTDSSLYETETTEKVVVETEALDNETLIESEVDENEIEIQYKDYEDSYLSYEIPSTWEVYETFFDETTYGITFSPYGSIKDTLSNIYVEIVDVKEIVVYDMTDYGDEALQESFHEYLVKEVITDYPEEAAVGEFLTTMIDDHYVYTFAYEVEVGGRKVVQKIYAPMGYEYPIMIYTTNWFDGEESRIYEITEHIIETLDVKESSLEWATTSVR